MRRVERRDRFKAPPRTRARRCRGRRSAETASRGRCAPRRRWRPAAAGTAGIHELGILERRGKRRGRSRAAQPASASITSPDHGRAPRSTPTRYARSTSSAGSGVVRRSMNRRGTSASMTTRAVGGHVADDAGDPVQPGNLLPVELLLAVEGDRNAPRVERKPRRDHLQQLVHSLAVRARDQRRRRIRSPQPPPLVGGRQRRPCCRRRGRHIRGADLLQDPPHRRHRAARGRGWRRR